MSDVYGVLFSADDTGSVYVHHVKQKDDKPFKVRASGINPDNVVHVPLFYPEYKIFLYVDTSKVTPENAGALIDVMYQNGELTRLLTGDGNE